MGSSKNSGRFTALGLGAITSMIVLALAVVFANSYSTGLVAANARALHSTNSILGSSAVVRAANNQAVLFAREAALGVSSTEARDLAITEARNTLSTFQNVAAQTDPSVQASHPALDDQIAVVISSFETALDLAELGQYEQAFVTLENDFETTWSTMRSELRTSQAEIVERISDTESLAGLVRGLTRFLAIVLLPVVALIIYRRIVRGQVRERRIEYEANLAYERKLNASKDELIAAVSHQLRTPLTGIYGMADVLSDGKGVDQTTANELASLIRSEAFELNRMVADLLVKARLDAGAATFMQDEFLVVNAIQRAVEPARKSGQQIKIAFDEPVRATGDHDRVVHVLRNLLSNADKYGGPNVRITGSTQDTQIEIAVVANRRILALMSSVLIIVALLAPAVVLAESSEEVARDFFSQAAFGKGSGDWSTDWIEVGESDGEASGDVRVVGGSNCNGTNCARIATLLNIGDRGLYRGVDLEDATSATLTFTYRRKAFLLPGGTFAVQARQSGSQTWSGNLWSKSLNGSDASHAAVQVPLTAFASEETQVRFVVTAVSVNTEVYFDNVVISASFDGPTTTTTTTTSTLLPTTTSLPITTTTIDLPITTTTITIPLPTLTTTSTTTPTTIPGLASTTTDGGASGTDPEGAQGSGGQPSNEGGPGSSPGDSPGPNPSPLTPEDVDLAAASNIAVDLSTSAGFESFGSVGINPLTGLSVGLLSTVEALGSEVVSGLMLGGIFAFFALRRVTDETDDEEENPST